MASVDAAAKRAEAQRATQSRSHRALERFGFIARAWWALWLLFTLVGFGLRAVGVNVPPIVGGALFLASVVGFYVLMRRDMRGANTVGH